MPTIYYSGCLVISSYPKSSQQCFEILLNYKKLQKYIAIKKIKSVKKNYSKESNNPYKAKATDSLAGLTLHSETEQIYFTDIIYI